MKYKILITSSYNYYTIQVCKIQNYTYELNDKKRELLEINAPYKDG